MELINSLSGISISIGLLVYLTIGLVFALLQLSLEIRLGKLIRDMPMAPRLPKYAVVGLHVVDFLIALFMWPIGYLGILMLGAAACSNINRFGNTGRSAGADYTEDDEDDDEVELDEEELKAYLD